MRPAPLRESLPDHTMPTSGDFAATDQNLLIIDDDPEMLRTLVMYFEMRGFAVSSAITVAAAKTSFRQQKAWSLIVSDYHLPDGTGWDLFCWIRDQPGGAPPPFLLMSGSVQSHTLGSGVEFLAKPFAIGDLESRVRMLLKRE